MIKIDRKSSIKTPLYKGDRLVLGIESSCDETAVAVVREDGAILSNCILSKMDEHIAFGGVVPEIAARAHMDHMQPLIQSALIEVDVTLDDINAVAATSGPGLIGGVMVGMMAGKAIAYAKDIPFMGVNHLEGHALTARLTDQTVFPYLVLLVSGGHTQILVAESLGVYKRLGTTLDDALGECFDKSAKLIGLDYPGGPNLEKMALKCKNPQAALARFKLAQPLKERAGCDFSFSGLKTSVRNHVDKLPEGDIAPSDAADMAYAFQVTVTDILKDRVQNAISQFLSTYGDKCETPTLVVCGGVAANQSIRYMLEDLTHSHQMAFIAPPLELCSDNAAMIAWVGVERMQKADYDDFDLASRPRWPLDETAEKLRRQ